MNKKTTIVAGIIVFMLLCVVVRMAMTKHSEKVQAESIKQSMTAQVELMKPLAVKTSDTVEAPGRIVAVQSTDVIARVQGMVLKQHYKDGDFVKKGQLLYTIDPTEFQIAVDRAKANLETAKAQQYQAQKDFERAAELVKSDFVSKSAYDQALATKDAANATVRANIAALNDARRLLSYTRITAPITGKISSPIVTVGNFLSSPNTVLTKIVSVDPIYVTYSLDSGLFNQLKNNEIIPAVGQKQPIRVEITLPDGTVYEKTGKADFLDNVISETTGTITLRATFPNPKAALIPGDFVNVKVYSNKVLDRIAVPQSAVLQDTDGRYLYVVDDKNIAHKRIIQTNGQKDNNWIVTSGISADESFVSTGIIKVRDNAPVVVVSKDSAVEIKEKDEK